MGRDFRDSSYYRRTWFSKRTVKDGEACVLWSLGGKATEIVGPRRFRTFFSTIRFLDRSRAGPYEYLRVTHRSGHVAHVRGPAAVWLNPVLHEDITVEKAVHLASPNEALVVYCAAVGEEATPIEKTNTPTASRLDRVVVRGPTVFAPNFGERVHEFRWTDNGKVRKFTTLRLATSAVTISAPVATPDGGGAVVTLRVGYRLDDVDRLLGGCEDLPAELAGALTSDFVAAGRLITVDALRDASALLGEMRGEETKSEAAVRALPRVAARAAELGVALRFAEVVGAEPDAATRRRFAAADEDARAVAAEADRARAEARARKDAEAEHAATVARTEREAEVAALEETSRAKKLVAKHEADLAASTRAAELRAREHEAAVEAARRELQLADIAAEKDSKEVKRFKIRAGKETHVHDEQVRFIAALKATAGVDTSGLLCSTGSTSSPLDGLSQLVSSKLQPAFVLSAGGGGAVTPPREGVWTPGG